MDKSKLDDSIKRFDERMAEDEKRCRPKRTHEEIICGAIEAVKIQMEHERTILESACYPMASQKQAQMERIRDLEWLQEDLEDLKDR